MTDRYRLLPNDEDFVFDFNKSQAPFADRKTFPALTGSGGSMAAAALARECPEPLRPQHH